MKVRTILSCSTMTQCNVNFLPEKCANWTSSFGLKDKYWRNIIHICYMFWIFDTKTTQFFNELKTGSQRSARAALIYLVFHSSECNSLLHFCTHNTCNLSLLPSLRIIFLSSFRSDTLLVNHVVLVLFGKRLTVDWFQNKMS